MRKSLLLFLFIFIYSFNQAQGSLKGIHLAMDESAYKSDDLPIFLKNDVNELYFYTNSSNQLITIFKYAEDFSLVSKTEISLPKIYASRFLLELKISNSKLLIFSTFSNREKKTANFYTESFDIETGESSRDEVQVAEKDNWTTAWNTTYSPDGSKLVRFKGNAFNNIDEFDILVFDEEYSILNTNTKFTMDHYDFSLFGGNGLNAFLLNTSVKVDNDGGVYFLRKVYNKDDVQKRKVKALVNRVPAVNFEKEEQFYSYILYRAVKENDYKLESYKLEAKPGFFIKDAFLEIIGHDSVLVSGNYSEKDDLNSKGAFSIIPDFDEENVVAQEYFPYSKEFITSYTSSWEKEKIENAIDNNKLWDYFDYNVVGFEKYLEGHIIFLEQQFDFFISYNATNTASVTLYNNLIGIYVNKDGTINKVIKIPKRQEEVDQSFASMGLHSIDNGHIQFVFNGPSIKKSNSSNSITAIILDENQKLTVSTIATKKEYPGFINLQNAWIKPNIILGNYRKSLFKKKYNNIIIIIED